MKNASEQQAIKLAAVVVEHNGLFTRGASEDVQWAIQNGTDAVELFLAALKNRVKEVVAEVKTTILDFVQLYIVPATTEKFVAGRNFLLKQNGGICSYLGDNFRSWFLEGGGKVEEPRSETVLRCHKLRKSSVDGPIITELGGEAVVETTLAEMFALLKKQANGEKGVLLTNGYANIFYVRDQFGVVRAVHACWRGDGWRVSAFGVSFPFAWGAGLRVFSRNPSGSL